MCSVLLLPVSLCVIPSCALLLCQIPLLLPCVFKPSVFLSLLSCHTLFAVFSSCSWFFPSFFSSFQLPSFIASQCFVLSFRVQVLVCFLWVYFMDYFSPVNKGAISSLLFHVRVLHLGRSSCLPHSLPWQRSQNVPIACCWAVYVKLLICISLFSDSIKHLQYKNEALLLSSTLYNCNLILLLLFYVLFWTSNKPFLS